MSGESDPELEAVSVCGQCWRRLRFHKHPSCCSTTHKSLPKAKVDAAVSPERALLPHASTDREFPGREFPPGPQIPCRCPVPCPRRAAAANPPQTLRNVLLTARVVNTHRGVNTHRAPSACQNKSRANRNVADQVWGLEPPSETRHVSSGALPNARGRTPALSACGP